jgi:hypothetical protein
MAKLTEIDKLKYWIDTEFTILHIMFAIIMLQLTHGVLPTVIFGVYLFISVVYAFTRMAYVAYFDKNYLRIPKK